jgi:type VI secretion system protein
MTLTLVIRNAEFLENGAPIEFVMHRRGATIGRAPTCDWSLPDPHRYISSKHCEIVFRDETYVLSDVSTNGTFLNGTPQRMSGERIVAAGDVFQIGHYEIAAELSGSALAALAPDPVAGADEPGWAGWEGPAPAPAPEPAGRPPSDEWSEEPYAQPPAAPADGGWEPTGPAGPEPVRWGAPPPPAPAPASSGWDPSHRAQMPVASVWQDSAPAADPASAWSSAAPDRPPPPSADDVWGRIAEGNVVDWARGGFGQPVPAPHDPLGLAPKQAAPHLPRAAPRRPEPAPAASPAAAPGPPVQAAPAPGKAPPPAADAERLVRDFLVAAGLDPAAVKGAGPPTLAKAGTLLHRLVAGLVVLVEARARAKSQMGAESTRLEFDGNNPIKFSRSPEQALAQLLAPKERGFMESERAIEDAFFDLQSHQMATLKAMQGALKATLDRFSPEAIRKRTEHSGLLARLLPGGRDAALWQSYEHEFSGVAQGSDEAFMDVFAKEFRKAYEEQARQRR